MHKTRLNNFTGGLNKGMPPHLIDRTECSELQNVVYRLGEWVKRPGLVNRTATGNSDAILDYVDYVDVDGSVSEIAGSNKNLYYWNGSTWTSRFTTGATRASTDKWHFAEFFGKSYATNGVDGIIVSTDPSSINYSAVTWTGEKQVTQAKIILTMNQRLFFINTTDSLDGQNVNRIIYSNVVTSPSGDETSIPSGNWVPMDFTQSPIQAACVMPNRIIALWTEDKVASLVDTGANPNFVVKFSADHGIFAPKAHTPHPRGEFFVGQGQFYVFTGGSAVPLNATEVEKYFFSTVDSNKANTYCWTDLDNTEIHIIYPTSGEEPNKHLVWNYAEDVWSEFTNITAFCGAYLFRGKSTPEVVYGRSAGIVADNTGTTDNGTAIPTVLATKGFKGNYDLKEQFSREIDYDYVQTQAIQTDAIPNTTTVSTQGADYGRGPYATESSDTIDDTGGYSPLASVWGHKHYQRWKFENFTSFSEVVLEYTGESVE